MVLALVVVPNRYCIPGRTIQENLFLLCDLLATVERFSLNISLVPLDPYSL